MTTPPTTVGEAFQQTSQIAPGRVALRTPGDQQRFTWFQYADNVRKLAAGYAALGLRRGDTIAFMMTNRPEFAWCDSAAMHLGATCFSIYNTSSPEQVAYLFGNAENKIVVAEEQFIPVILAAGVDLEHVICVDGSPEGATATLEEVMAGGDPDFDFDAAWQAVQPDDILCLIYTSGTTGPPKGVQLSHDNVLATLEAGAKVVDTSFGDRGLSYLPAAHVADRVLALYSPAYFGAQVTYVADPRQLIEALPDTRPNVWLAVPRIWEKIKAGIEQKIADEPSPVKAKLGAWALDIAAKKATADLAGSSLSKLEQIQFDLADKIILSRIREALGLDELKWCWSGAASIAPETLTFFFGLGLDICEIWGMSESCGSGTLNPPGKAKVGTVGPPLPGTEVKLADDGELLIRGRGVMVGYRNEPEKTAETIDADGWLHTGDIGTVDADGYYSIVDRKKEIIINAAGKNMSPANIENTIKTTTPLAAAVAVIGDGRAYNVGLITLDPDAAAAYAEKAGIAADPEVLAEDPGLLAAIDKGVAAGNAKLSRVEQLKKYQVLPTFWMPGGDEMTPTMKLRRKPIAEKYADAIEALYA